MEQFATTMPRPVLHAHYILATSDRFVSLKASLKPVNHFKEKVLIGSVLKPKLSFS